jgi:ankyrin repeat protein
MDSLASKMDRRSIWRALEDLPTGLQDAHRKAIERIESQNKDAQELAGRTLSFLSYALRPITFIELQHALAIEIGAMSFDKEGLIEKDFILLVCAGLVVLQKESNIIRFVHYSTQEYFRTTRDLQYPDAETKIAHACLSLLSYDDFKGMLCSNQTEIESFDAKYPFYNYAAMYWGDHARGDGEIALQTEILQFLDREVHMFCATQAMIAVESRWPYAIQYILAEPPAALWVAASFGLDFIVGVLLQNPIDVNVYAHYKSRPHPGNTALQAASDHGHTKVVRRLLIHGANPNDCCGEHDSSLIAAAFHGHTEIVHLLLDAGATADNYGYDWTALGAASYSGHDDTVSLLLENGADINKHQGFGTGCALQAASISGQEEVVRLLLASGAEVNTLGGGRLGTSLRSGKERNDTTYIERVRGWANGDIWRALQRPDVLDTWFADALGCEKPLHCAAFYGHLGVARSLINAGAEIDSPGEFWGTALQAASLMGNLEMMQFLIEAGANVSAPGLALGDALQAASLYGYEDAVQLLLENGATVRGNGVGQFYSSALQAAALRGHQRLVRRLLQEYSLFERLFVFLCESVVAPISFSREKGKKWCYA